LLFLCQKQNREKKIHSPLIPYTSNSISANYCLFSRVCRTILQQWFVRIYFENFTNYFGYFPLFGGRYYLRIIDFISSEIDLENTKNLEERVEKQYFTGFERAIGGVFSVLFPVGNELLSTTAF